MQELKIKPAFDCILVKMLEKEEIVKGGIILPSTVEASIARGKIIDMGKGTFSQQDGRLMDTCRDIMGLEIGDIIVFNKFQAIQVADTRGIHHIVKALDVCGIYKMNEVKEINNA